MGAEAIFDKSNGPGRTPQLSDTFEEVPCVTIETAVKHLDQVDVMHFDIQGVEADVIEQSVDVLDHKVRRIVVGTHGRDIEQRLLKFLDSRAWSTRSTTLFIPANAARHHVSTRRRAGLEKPKVINSPSSDSCHRDAVRLATPAKDPSVR